MVRKNRRRGDRFAADGDINPMNYAANMADAMLILAVGIMLALIVHYNVDVSTTGAEGDSDGLTYSNGNEVINTEEAIQFDESDLQEKEDQQEEGTGMDRLGEVYYDSATGKYYVVKEK